MDSSNIQVRKMCSQRPRSKPDLSIIAESDESANEEAKQLGAQVVVIYFLVFYMLLVLQINEGGG